MKLSSLRPSGPNSGAIRPPRPFTRYWNAANGSVTSRVYRIITPVASSSSDLRFEVFLKIRNIWTSKVLKKIFENFWKVKKGCMTKLTYRSNQCQPLNSTLKMSNLGPPIDPNGDTMRLCIAYVVFTQIEFWTWVIYIKLIHLNNFIKY